MISGADISIRGLSRSYEGRKVLQDINLDIPAGQFVSILGTSGVGKSTLLKILAGVETPTCGDAWASGTKTKPTVRIMFQEDRLLAWRTVLGNVTLGLRHGEPNAMRMLDAVGLAGREHAFPVVLSGGQRQRVALARALVHEPNVLLLDEPFGALDAITRSSMHILLQGLLDHAPRTVLLVTHDVDEALILSDRVLVLTASGIAADITVDVARPRHHSQLAEKKDYLLGLLSGTGTTAQFAQSH
ncbi:ABC transporter ATP-binding protein [Phyllobacterium chamaecytisi]|uniref:ABC transporter ATP-binding protein n=1 Tax=Phyllobacterium chamaecytisi TaxID=2876082 RepID=UPI001CCFB38D|nr:ABC transporter ATP-binding protein [Phyllobacterium sp. KW56]MBZ9603220.1 ABC transporter ATP-binding protein [Phyllobacterium sp. KW56]